MIKQKPKVAFICVHNSCRSQIAEALAKHVASDVFESYSAGTQIKSQINPDALRLIKQRYHISMEKEQHCKLLHDIPPVDIVITMGCNVHCPTLSCGYREDWGLPDPTGCSDQKFNEIINSIQYQIENLVRRINANEIPFQRL